MQTALQKLKNYNKEDDLNIIIFGGNKADKYSEIDLKIHHFNKIENDTILISYTV